jgi:glycosyltransferase involved in cell wall biosynthesis
MQLHFLPSSLASLSYFNMADPSVSPLISVITVVFNAETTIERTIQSVIAQRDVRIEYIVIDGGSTDGTRFTIQNYQEHITTWLSEPDKGVYDAMNKGIRQAKGDWIIFLNAGDLFVDNNSLSLLEQAALSDRDTPDLVFGDALLVKTDGTTERMEMKNTLPFLIRHSICHQSMLYRRSSFEKIGLFDTSYKLAADFDHLIRMKWQGAKLLKLDATIARYALDGLSAKRENISKIWKERMRMYSTAKSMPLLVRAAFWMYAKLAYEFRKNDK